MQAQADVPVYVTSPASSSERRISPSWTVARFKARLEPITGIPAASQHLTLKLPGTSTTGGGDREITIVAEDEEVATLDRWPFRDHAEINVKDTRPPSERENLSDPNQLAEDGTPEVPKYVMPASQYERLSDSVLNYKRTKGLGRFAPDHAEKVAALATADSEAIAARGIAVGLRCRLLPASDDRRGQVGFVGQVDGLPGSAEGRKWVGIRLDEPVGKNNGTGPTGRRYFECPDGGKFGVFVKPDKVEMGDFDVEDGLESTDGEEMEEI